MLGRRSGIQLYKRETVYNKIMASFSFDVVSDYNQAEMNNAIDQVKREIANRYDFKGTKASVEFSDSNKTGLTIIGDNNYHIDTLLDMVRKKLAARGIDQTVLNTESTPVLTNLKVTKSVTFKKGLDQSKAKQISNLIRQNYPKAKTQIQGDSVRVSSAKKDELQNVIQLLKQQEFDFPLDFINYR